MVYIEWSRISKRIFKDNFRYEYDNKQNLRRQLLVLELSS